MTERLEPDEETRDRLPADVTATLVAFARACKSAARAVMLYPGTHPAVSAGLTAVAAAARTATTSGPLSLSVTPDTLVVGRQRIEKPDSAVTELAALLHAHQVGQLIIQ